MDEDLARALKLSAAELPEGSSGVWGSVAAAPLASPGGLSDGGNDDDLARAIAMSMQQDASATAAALASPKATAPLSPAAPPAGGQAAVELPPEAGEGEAAARIMVRGVAGCPKVNF